MSSNKDRPCNPSTASLECDAPTNCRQRGLQSKIHALGRKLVKAFDHDSTGHHICKWGANGEIPAAMRSALTKCITSASRRRNSRANVVLPAPFGPARIIAIGTFELYRRLTSWEISTSKRLANASPKPSRCALHSARSAARRRDLASTLP